jgi:hypothetical protein
MEDKLSEFLQRSNDRNFRTKESHIKTMLARVKHRAKRSQLDYSLDFEYVLDLAPDVCPVFKTDLLWGLSRVKNSNFSPSMDRIDPTQGYVKGNVQIISQRANLLKNNASLEEHEQLINWMKNNG